MMKRMPKWFRRLVCFFAGHDYLMTRRAVVPYFNVCTRCGRNWRQR